jgi:hypothetical protein
VPLQVRPDPLADPTAAVPLRLYYELPDDFPPGRPLLVQFDDDLVHHWQPVAPIGQLDLPLGLPGGHLLRVECAIPGTEAFVNAVPLGAGEQPRWRLRQAILIPPDAPCSIDLRSDAEARSLRVSIPCYLPADLPAERSHQLIVRLHGSDGRILAEHQVLLLADTDRRAAVHTSNDGRWFYAGRISLDPPPGLNGWLEILRPTGVPLLIRPFQTLAWDEQASPGER